MSKQKQYNGKYNQLQMIGKGRYGTIYRIKEVTTLRQYVAKHIPLDQIQQTLANKQLQIIKNLRHPYIVEYIDSFTSDQEFVIIMEYCKQKDLDYHIQNMKSRNKHFNQNLIITWLFQLVLGIQFIHSKKILHRDIKPQNVFIHQTMNIKIGDFGISKTLISTGQQCTTITGTPFYLSPQIINEEPYTIKADIWSLGCVIYQVCALEKPFEAKGGILKLMQLIKTSQIKPIPKMYSDGLRKLLDKMLTRDQTKRPDTSQLLQDPLLMDLMIKSSSSMSLRQQYSRNIDKPQQSLSQSFINRQTNMVYQQLKRFELEIQVKMQGLKKKNLNSQDIDEQYKEVKKKMEEIQKVIRQAFTEIKKKTENNGEGCDDINNDNDFKKNSQKVKKSTLDSSSVLGDSSEMTIIQSIVVGEKFYDKKEGKIISGSATYESVPLNSARTDVPEKLISQNLSITQSLPFTQTNSYIDLNFQINRIPQREQESFDQTLQSQYQQTIKPKAITKDTLDKLDLLKQTISRNPTSVLDESLLCFTLTMSEQEIRKEMKKDKVGKNGMQNIRLKANNNLDDTLNLDITKRSCEDLFRLQGAFVKKKRQGKSQKQQNNTTTQTININEQNNYKEDFEQYEQDFEDFSETDNLTLLQSKNFLQQQKRRLQMNTIKSFFQQSLEQIDGQNSKINSNQELSHSQKVKKKYPLLMSQIKEQTGEAGSILSKKNNSSGNNSLFRLG